MAKPELGQICCGFRLWLEAKAKALKVRLPPRGTLGPSAPAFPPFKLNFQELLHEFQCFLPSTKTVGMREAGLLKQVYFQVVHSLTPPGPEWQVGSF